MLKYIVKIYTNIRERIYRRSLWRYDFAYWKKLEDVVLEDGKKGYRIRTETLGITQPGQELTHLHSDEIGERVIADIDHDGLWLSYVGQIPNVETVTEADFRPRRRAFLKVVDIEGFIGVKKDFRGDYCSFVNELRTLHLLGIAGGHVPAILKIDYKIPSLTISYIKGAPLSEKLAKRGALLRNRYRNSHPDLVGLSRSEQNRKGVQSAKLYLYEVIDQLFVQQVFVELEKLHAVRTVWNDIKYGNILIEEASGEPYLIDFAYSRYYPKLWKKLFTILCEKEKKSLRFYFDC